MNENSPAQAVRLISHWKLWPLAVLVGGVAGVGAVVFRWLIGFFHNLFFLGKLSILYDANVHTPTSSWGAWVILVPVVGAAGVVGGRIRAYSLESSRNLGACGFGR